MICSSINLYNVHVPLKVVHNNTSQEVHGSGSEVHVLVFIFMQRQLLVYLPHH